MPYTPLYTVLSGTFGDHEPRTVVTTETSTAAVNPDTGGNYADAVCPPQPVKRRRNENAVEFAAELRLRAAKFRRHPGGPDAAAADRAEAR
jgi:hypothetical protein